MDAARGAESNLGPGGSDLIALGDALSKARDPEALIRSLGLPAFFHDGRQVRAANTLAADWLGYGSPRALEGLEIAKLARSEDERALRAALGASEAGPHRQAHVQRFVRRSGEPLVGRVLSRATRIAGREAFGAVLEPWSLANRAGDLLRLLEVSIDQLHDIVFITEADAIDDVGRRIVFVNQAFTRATGFQPVEVLGKTPSVTVGDRTDRETLRRIAQGLEERRPIHEELLKYGKGGVEYWVELDIIPVFDEAGVHTHWVSVQRDISERKRLEQRLVESAQLASAGVLAANLASEINNPLAAVSCSLEWLAERLPDVLARATAIDPTLKDEVVRLVEGFDDARTAAERVGATTSFLRLLAGSGPAARRATGVAEVLEAAVTETTREVRLAGRLVRDYEPVPNVLADSHRLSHAFRLTLKNALQSLPVENEATNTVTLRLRALPKAVVLSIEDTGVGVPSDMTEKLFTPFATTKPRGIANGLGLFVADRLVREIDGSIELRPREGGGTIAEIRLPVAPAGGADVLRDD